MTRTSHAMTFCAISFQSSFPMTHHFFSLHFSQPRQGWIFMPGQGDKFGLHTPVLAAPEDLPDKDRRVPVFSHASRQSQDFHRLPLLSVRAHDGCGDRDKAEAPERGEDLFFGICFTGEEVRRAGTVAAPETGDAPAPQGTCQTGTRNALLSQHGRCSGARTGLSVER